MSNLEYARDLANRYGISPDQPYDSLIANLSKELEARKHRLQKTYQMKAAVPKIQQANTDDKKTGESKDHLAAKLAELRRELEKEIQMRAATERMLSTDTYKGGSKDQLARAQDECAKATAKAMLWEDRLQEMKQRIVVERMIMIGMRKAIKATSDKTVRHTGAIGVRESIQKLCLLQMRFRELLNSPPMTEQGKVATCSLSTQELQQILSSPLDSRDYTSLTNSPTNGLGTSSKEVTGTVQLRINGCYDLLDVFPPQMVYGDYIAFNEHYPTG
ncbi:Serine/threonine-protein kinase N2, partial [Cichlidogyrus casuarinus]